MNEPIRLVCSECDTVHRVKKVTLGKLYRCKKCREPLITMSPAIVKCPSCDKSYPPAHVDVSRLITCDVCEDEPLMTLEFPPPVRPVREVRSAPPPPATEQTNQAPADEAQQTETEPTAASLREEASESSLPPPKPEPQEQEQPAQAHQDTPASSSEPQPEEHALATAGAEDRAVQALRKVLEEVQAPLVQEIERSRSSVPMWTAMVISLPVLAVMGYLVNSYMRSDRVRDTLAKTDGRLEERAKHVTALQQELKELQRELRQARSDREALRVDLTNLRRRQENDAAMNAALKKLLKRQQESLEAFQETVNARDAEIRTLRQQIRALGHDPEAASALNRSPGTP